MHTQSPKTRCQIGDKIHLPSLLPMRCDGIAEGTHEIFLAKVADKRD